MRTRDEFWDEDPEAAELRAEDRRRRRQQSWHCRCGNPDLPGTCPGWQNCPMWADEAGEEEDH